MPRILAIDWGAKRVGLAVTDPLQIIVTALDTIPTDRIMRYLKDYTKVEEVEQFVLGWPTHADGNDTDSTPFVRRFHERLQELFPAIPVALEDERGTSQMAVQGMIDAGFKKKDRRKKENVDKLSAVLILRSYLEQF